MESGKDKGRGAAAKRAAAAPRPEFEVAYFTKELGRPLQRKMLREQLASLTDEGQAGAARHGEDAGEEQPRQPPQADRAG